MRRMFTEKQIKALANASVDDIVKTADEEFWESDSLSDWVSSIDNFTDDISGEVNRVDIEKGLSVENYQVTSDLGNENNQLPTSSISGISSTEYTRIKALIEKICKRGYLIVTSSSQTTLFKVNYVKLEEYGGSHEEITIFCGYTASNDSAACYEIILSHQSDSYSIQLLEL